MSSESAMLMVMNFVFDYEALDTVLPGVTQAYRDLRSPDFVGIYTSNGELFNHTFFGRDAGMTAKFVADFDHEVALEAIYMLAAYQGVEFDDVTGEQPGKIHHELRDFTTWQGSWFHRIGFYFLRSVWGVENHRLLTYFADDSTATYIRLVHKYATRIDQSILTAAYKDKHAQYATIAESVERAANWIVGNLNADGLLIVKRSNSWALPFQIFQDSVTAYAWSDGKLANYSQPISYVETQAYGLDALMDACHLLPKSHYLEVWRESIDKMIDALLNNFWTSDEDFFASCISQRSGSLKPLDVPNVSAGFTLNNLFWKDIPMQERSQKISRVVERLFSDEFLTDVGLRTRSKYHSSVTKKHIEYHDQSTVWPMFNFMVIEGLRKHRLYRLAEQLEWRLLRAAKSIEGFQEFYIVDEHGKVYNPFDHAERKLSAQMRPERNIAFTVVPMMVIARRQNGKQIELEQADWQAELEKSILSRIDLLTAEMIDEPIEVIPVKIRRTMAGISAFKSLILKRVRN